MDSAQTFSEEVPLSLLTMIVGAILGAVLAPVGDALVSQFLTSRNKERGIYGAFLLFFVANGVWIIGEMLTELFVRSQDNASGVVVVVMLLLFFVAVLVFVIGFRQVPTYDHATLDRGLARTLRYLILGNVLWIIGEVVEAVADELWPDYTYAGYHPATWLRVLLSLVAVGIFIMGALSSWRLIPQASAGETGNKARPHGA